MSTIRALRRPGRHETRLRRVFRGALRYRGRARFATPLVVMGFTNRAGSHLLGDFLRQTGRIGGLGEVLNHDVAGALAGRLGAASLPDYIAALTEHYAPEDGLFGLKASWDQLAMLLRADIPSMYGGGVKLVHLVRQDVVAQAVSLSLARQTGRWTAAQEGNGRAPRFDARAIARGIAAAEAGNLNIRLIAGACGLPRSLVTYEQICADPATHVGRVLAFCGTPAPGWQPRPPALKKQGGEEARAFAARYRALLRDAVTAA